MPSCVQCVKVAVGCLPVPASPRLLEFDMQFNVFEKNVQQAALFGLYQGRGRVSQGPRQGALGNGLLNTLQCLELLRVKVWWAVTGTWGFG